MILAAGRGARLRPLTDNTPKPLLKVGKLSLIEHLILNLRKHDFTQIVINVAYLGDQIVETLGVGERYDVKISYSHEEGNGLETGGGIVNAQSLLGEDPFLVVSGDIWTDYPFNRLRKINLESLGHLILVDNFKEHEHGDFHLLDGRLHPSAGTRLTFGNIGIYHPRLFEGYTPGFFRLAPILEQAIQNNQITGEYYSGEWENVGTMDALNALRKKADPIQPKA